MSNRQQMNKGSRAQTQSSSGVEEQLLLKAAEQILTESGSQPMHYTEIKRLINERNLVSPSLKTTLEAALCRDTQQPNNKFTVVAGRPGYFTLVTDGPKQLQKTPPHQHQPAALLSTTSSPNSAPRLLKMSPTTAKSTLKLAGLKSPLHTSPKSQGQISPKISKSPSSLSSSPLKSPGHAKGTGSFLKGPHRSTAYSLPRSHLLFKGQARRKLLGKSAEVHQPAEVSSANSKYERRYRRLKKVVKDMIFLNASVCDEAVRIEERVAIAKEERRYLLKRLLQQQALSELLTSTFGKQTPPANIKTSSQSIAQILGEIEKKTKKKVTPPHQKAKVSRQSLDDSVKSKAKKSKSNKKLVQPIPLDNSGRPVFPIELGHLTVYCLGEVSSSRVGFHTADYIYPIGFYSTRTYLAVSTHSQHCLYNCKIIDGGSGPKFEIAAEGDGEVGHLYTGNTASECHNKLLQAINQARGEEVASLGDKGADFFGFAHPTIQNLIQSLPGARKCNKYKWVKYEVNRDGVFYVEEDVSVSYDAVCTKTATVQGDSNADESNKSGNLRNLLVTAGQPPS